MVIMEKSFGVKLNMVVETNLSADEFNDKFVAWVEENGWLCGGCIQSIDEEGNAIQE